MEQAMTIIVYDDIYLEHDIGEHVEGASRLTAIVDYLRAENAWPEKDIVEPRSATEAEVRLVHTQSLIDQIRRIAEGGGGHVDADTELCARSYEVALYAVGGVLTAIDKVMAGVAKNALCLVRPPGHHATPTQSMGFCLFNNAAIGARYAQQKHALKKIAIIDWDVHHGNGTQEAFYDDPTVLYFSMHRYPFYPGTGYVNETGRGAGKGVTINIPLPYGVSNTRYLEMFREVMSKHVEPFKPEMIIISAGFDGHVEDIIGNFCLHEEDFRLLTDEVCRVAEATCGGRVVSTLEGGYNLNVLPKCVHEHLRSLQAHS
jgi:acetoin utilization deacetylase AcuC-like enzyme